MMVKNTIGDVIFTDPNISNFSDCITAMIKSEMVLCGCDFYMEIFYDVDFRNTDFAGSNFVNCIFNNCKFNTTKMVSCNLSLSTFDNCVIRYTKFNDSTMSGVRFIDCKLDDADFDKCLVGGGFNFRKCLGVRVIRLMASNKEYVVMKKFNTVQTFIFMHHTMLSSTRSYLIKYNPYFEQIKPKFAEIQNSIKVVANDFT